MNNTTIVSAYMTQVNKHRNIDLYINYGTHLLQIHVPKIIFIEKDIYDTYFSQTSFPLTEFIFFEKNENYLYDHTHHITNFHVNTDNQNKDTLDYMCIQCHKTEWVKKAIEYNSFGTDQFIWMDFGIYHMIKEDSLFEKYVFQMTQQSYSDSIRIPSCWDPDHYICQKDIYQNITWYFAGSVFGGDQDTLLVFADKMREKCLDLIENKKHLMWEINVWYLIYRGNPSLFSYYNSGHNASILSNY